MPSHDSEEFGGELYHDIIARIERSWGIWLNTISRIDERDERQVDLAISLMDETAHGDEAAVDVIRTLLEGESDHDLGVRAEIAGASGLAEGRRIMGHHHDRLLGAIEAASQASNDMLETVRVRIGSSTWQQYEDRAARLNAFPSVQDA